MSFSTCRVAQRLAPQTEVEQSGGRSPAVACYGYNCCVVSRAMMVCSLGVSKHRIDTDVGEGSNLLVE